MRDGAIVIFIIAYYILLGIGVYVYDNYREPIGEFLSRVSKTVKRGFKKLFAKITYEWDSWKAEDIIRWTIKNLCFVGVGCWLVWVFEKHWFTWYAANIGKYADIPIELANVLIAIYIACVFLLIALQSGYRSPLNWKRWGYTTVIGAAIYVYFRFFSDSFHFTTLSFVDTSIAYMDVVMFFTGLYVLDRALIEILRDEHVQANSEKQEENYFYHDAPLQPMAGDSLGFTGPSNLIREKLKTLSREQSWTVGIVGPWGSGKTSYINLIKEFLPKDEYIVVCFNPRFASKPEKIQELALDMLADAIKPYHSGIRPIIRRYAAALQLEGASGWVQVALSMLKSSYGVTELKEELQEIIAKLPKQMVFVFDDFDRLTGKEILEVLKLIDGNANFKNIIYIAAYDHQQVNAQIGDAYIDKYFSIEIHVPLYYPADLINYMKDELRKILPAAAEGDKLVMPVEDALSRHWGLFRKVLFTLRDAKRFLNMFKSDVLTIHSDNVETEDFLLIELLKYKNTRLYELLFAIPDQYLQFDAMIRVSPGTGHYKKLDTSDQEVLATLFPTSQDYGDRPLKIRRRDDFTYYFVRPDKTKERITLRELFDVSLSEERLMGRIRDVSEKTEVVEDFFGTFSQFGRLYIDDEKSFRRYLLIVLYFNRYVSERMICPDTWEIFKDSFYTTINEQRHKQFDHAKMGRVVMDYYADHDWTSGDVRVLSGVMIDLYYESKQRDYVVMRGELELIIRNRFAQQSVAYLANKKDEDFDMLMQLFHLCIDHVDQKTSKIWLDGGCCKRMREVIENEPRAYLEHFVFLAGESTSADVNHIACDGFWEQIFGDAVDMENWITQLDESKYPRKQRVRNFWEIYQANEYKMIEFSHQGNVQEIIDNDLREQVQQLVKLRDLEAQVTNARMLDRENRKRRIHAIMQEIAAVPLKVAYKGKVYQLAQEWS